MIGRAPCWSEVGSVPRHVAIIMDGNGRWAELLGRPRHEGHRAGSDAVRRAVRTCRRLGVRALTLYAFSEQNWERPQNEVEALMGLLREFLVSERNEILDHAIRLRAVGALSRLPPHVRSVLEPLSRESEDHRGMTLSLALSYGGQEEITNAAREMAERVARGELAADGITIDSFARAMPSMDVGPVDLLIRTSGEQRLSNFLLWGAAYAELYFCSTLWPEFGEDDLFRAFSAYQSRERRFGLVHAEGSRSEVGAVPSPPHA